MPPPSSLACSFSVLADRTKSSISTQSVLPHSSFVSINCSCWIIRVGAYGVRLCLRFRLYMLNVDDLLIGINCICYAMEEDEKSKETEKEKQLR
ncbi:hypothetical protein P8452_06575 [Trifolium repens]|nr:hypothetical protein P8452_06575 [Trifolium repens]